MNRLKTLSTAWLPGAAFVAVLALFLVKLGAMALWDNHETVYTQIVREMVERGDWITLYWRDVPWFCHPPLVYWLIAALSVPLGLTELTARLPAACFGAGCAAMAVVWGRALGSPRAGVLAAAALTLNFQVFVQSRMVTLDTAILFFLMVALHGFWRAYRGWRPGWYVLFVASGLACLAKGPFGLVFPWMLIVPFLALTGQLGRLREAPWRAGASLAAFIGLGWYGVELALHGRPFWDQALVYFTFSRLTSRVMDQGGPWWLYGPIFLAGMLPWSLFVPQATVRLWQEWQGRDRRTPSASGDAALLILLWMIVPFVFFSAAVTKLPNYILFAYPGAALAVGLFLDRALDERRGQLRAPIAAAAAVAVGILLLVRFWAERRYAQYDVGTWRIAEVALALFAAGALSAVVLVMRRRASTALAALSSGVAGFLLVCAWSLGPAIEQYRPVKRLGTIARAMLQPGDWLGIHRVPGEYGLIFYSRNAVTPLPDEMDVRRVLTGPERWVVVTSPEVARRVAADTDVRILADAGRAVLIGPRVEPAARSHRE
jgi:4-amino-4-deoxy-L-arabinose transferase-like glycosyltransferase